MFPSEQIFRDWVDGGEIPQRPTTLDCDNILEHYGLSPHENHSLDIISDHIKSRVEGLLPGGSRSNLSDLFILRKHLLLRHFLDGLPIENYYSILECIISWVSRTSDFAKLTSCEPRWREAVGLVREHMLIFNSHRPREDFRLFHPREAAVADSANCFRDRKYSVNVDNGRIDLSNGGELAIVTKLDSDIRLLGGHKLSRYLLDSNSGGPTAYSATYYLGSLGSSGSPAPEPLVPVGYLLNVAVKHLNDGLIAHPSERKLLNEIIEDARRLAALYDLQPYSKIEKFIKPRHSFIDIFGEYPFFDQMFRPRDLRPADVSRIILGIFPLVNHPSPNCGLKWSFHDAAAFADCIFHLCKQNTGPNVIKIDKLYNSLRGIDLSTIDQMLEDFSVEQQAISTKCLLPGNNTVDEDDFAFKPLIRLDKRSFCFMHPTLSAPGFYEAIYTALKCNRIRGLNQKIGDAFEKFIRNLLLEKGITVLNGDYKSDCVENGDFDAVVETKEAILLFECKKKGLSIESRQGDIVEVLEDLGTGLIKGLSQLTRQMLSLSLGESHALKVNDTNQLQSLALDGRRICNIVVSLKDYGAFHDNKIFRDVLNYLYTTGFTYIRENVEEKLNTEEKLQSLRDYRKILFSLYSGKSWGWFGDCIFMSLPQLLHILDDVSDAGSLKTAVELTRNVSYGSRDPIYEYELVKKVKTKRN